MLTQDRAVEIEVPWDRSGSFEPQIVAKGETRLDGFDDKITSLYARGMTVREIQGHLRELYAVNVSPDLISRVTDAVLDEVREWQKRGSVADLKTGPKQAKSTVLSIEDEAIIVAFRKDLTSYEYICKLWTKEPDRFILDPLQQM